MSDLDRLLEAIAGDDEWARHRALEALQDRAPTPDEFDRVLVALADPDATRRTAARMAMAALAAPDAAAPDAARAALQDALLTGGTDVRVLAASALGEAGDPRAGDALVEALEDPEPNVTAAAADALGALRYRDALEPLAALSEAETFWVRAAAVVALGRLEDERAVPVLHRLAGKPGLEKPIVEALRQIDHPSVLDPLSRIHEHAPGDALRAAGAVLAAHPDVPAPEWVRSGARRQEEALRQELMERDDPGLARLLGLAASDTAVDTLLSLVGPPRWSDAALVGIAALPHRLRSDAILDRLPVAGEAGERDLVVLLGLLPPLMDATRLRELLPLLGHEADEVRAAVAEALGRAVPAEALELLTGEIRRGGVTPEVIRAMGGLGEAACASLTPLLRDDSSAVRAAAASALSRCAGRAIEAELRRALGREPDDQARQALLGALGAVAGEGALDVLGPALSAAESEVRLAAIDGLGATRSEAAVPLLDPVLHRSRGEAMAALRALGQIGGAAAAARIESHLDSEDLDVRRAAALAAVTAGPHFSDARLGSMAADRDPLVRRCAARLLPDQRPESRARLERLAEGDPDPDVRQTARRRLAEAG